METKDQDFLENMKVAQFRSIDSFLQCHFICQYGIHTAQQPDFLFWCHAAVVSFPDQFTRVHYFVWPNLGANFLVLVFIA